MAAAGGFQFGSATANTGASNLFGFGANKSTPPSFGGFGTSSSIGANAFGAKSTSITGATPLFSLSGSGTTTTSGSLFGAPTQVTSTSSSLNLFGKPTVTAASVAPFAFGSAATTTNTVSQSSLSFATSSSASTIPGTSIATSVSQKQPSNPKDAEVPPELALAVQALEQHIKDQKAKKDEISRFSCKAITKVQEEIGILRQAIGVVSNAIQRDGIGVEMLKVQAAQDLKNAEIAQNVKEISSGYHYDYCAPIEYFQRLIQSFEERISVYRQELDDLDNYMSSSSPAQEITPQGLLEVLRKLGETFQALAAQLQVTHEEAKVLKNRYLHYRKTVLGDGSDLFNRRNKNLDGSGRPISVGPSPFTALAEANAVAMAAALNSGIHAARPTQATFFGSMSSQQTAIKATTAAPGLSRSLSLGGIGGPKTGIGQPAAGLGSILGGKAPLGAASGGLGTGQSAFGASQTVFRPSTGLLAQPAFPATATPALNAVTPFQQQNRFQLQNPPSGTKRGKLK